VSDFVERERAHLKGRWAYLLVLITCCAIAVVVQQQGDTIARQRSLIQLLWGDSKELNSLKIQELVNRHNHPKAPAEEAESAKPPADHAPAAKPPAKKHRAPKPQPPANERQAIEKPGPRVMRYI
jgi:hypothetical protein